MNPHHHHPNSTRRPPLPPPRPPPCHSTTLLRRARVPSTLLFSDCAPIVVSTALPRSSVTSWPPAPHPLLPLLALLPPASAASPITPDSIFTAISLHFLFTIAPGWSSQTPSFSFHGTQLPLLHLFSHHFLHCRAFLCSSWHLPISSSPASITSTGLPILKISGDADQTSLHRLLLHHPQPHAPPSLSPNLFLLSVIAAVLTTMTHIGVVGLNVSESFLSNTSTDLHLTQLSFFFLSIHDVWI